MKALDFRNDVLPLKDKIFRLALRITLNRAEAEDITQETLIRVWQQRDEWHQIENIEAYSLTIARRLGIDHVRKGKEEGLGERDDVACAPETLPDAQLEKRQRMEIVQRIINTLPETWRTIMTLRDIEGYRYEEIAQMTDLTETQVKVYLHRARSRVKQALTTQIP